jgi:uncharacterized protein YhbP (UPF0306 family)
MLPTEGDSHEENFFRWMPNRALTSPRKLVIIKGVAFKGRTSRVTSVQVSGAYSSAG